jgi:Na+-transporting methylmalonyl-CoA/oxaloacetate decarboxylase gamma subunit
MGELIQRAVELPWGYIMSTLVIRFVGVFIVLAILMVGMQVLGSVVSRLVSGQEARAAEARRREAHAVALAEAPERETGEEEIVAAMGAAIAVAMAASRQPISPPAHPDVTARSWAMAGRVALMNRRLPAGTQRRR